MNYYDHHIGDYAAATAHLSWDEDMAYSRLIRAYYHHERPIPLDLKEAYRLVRATSRVQRQAVETVLKEFFYKAEDGWRQKRCDEEIARYLSKRDKARGSANARWNAKRLDSEGNANASEMQCERIADALPTQCEGNAPSPNLQSQSQSQSPVPDSESSGDISPPNSNVGGDSQTLAADPPVGERGKVSKSGRRPSKRMPADYAPSESVRQWARENAPDVDFEAEYAACRDYEFKHARSDWDAVLRGWLRGEQKDISRRRGRTAPLNGAHRESRFDALMRESRARQVFDTDGNPLDEDGNVIPY